MKFVMKPSAKEVAFISPVTLESLPDDLKFSGISVSRVKGTKGSSVLVVGISDLFVFGKNAVELWRSPLVDSFVESIGFDSIRISHAEKTIELGLGVVRKKVFLHIANAAEFAKDPSMVQAEYEREFVPSKSKKELKEERNQQEEEQYGKVITTATLSNFRSVSLHSKGYVSGVGPRPEKLIAISGEANVVKKSALGRGLGAVVSLPLSGFTVSNLDSHNLRGDVYITIVTNVKTHSIHVDLAKQIAGTNPVGEMQKLVTAGEALIKQLGATVSNPTINTKVTDDLASQLSKLNHLYQSGALSEGEFSAAKSKLLDN
jgi:hypothetical protein